MCISTFCTSTKLPIKMFDLSNFILSDPCCHDILRDSSLFLSQYYFYWNSAVLAFSFPHPDIATFTGFFGFFYHLNLVIVLSIGTLFNSKYYFFILELLFLLFLFHFFALLHMAEVLKLNISLLFVCHVKVHILYYTLDRLSFVIHSSSFLEQWKFFIQIKKVL